MQTGRPVVLVLAAGAARRFGGRKLLACVHGRTLLGWTLHLARRSGADVSGMVVVTPSLSDPVATACRAEGVAALAAPNASRGMAWSLTDALDQLPETTPAAIVLLGDDPLAATALTTVLAHAREQQEVPAMVRREPPVPHPVYLPRATWPLARQGRDELGGDTGPGRWLRRHPGLVLLDPPANAPSPLDVDDQPALEQLAEALRSAGLT